MDIKDAVKAILEGNGLDAALTDLLEADASSQALLRELKANTGDVGIWVKTINTIARQGKFLKIIWAERVGSPVKARWFFSARPTAYSGAVFNYYIREASPGVIRPPRMGTIPYQVLIDGITFKMEVVEQDDLEESADTIKALLESDKKLQSLLRTATASSDLQDEPHIQAIFREAQRQGKTLYAVRGRRRWRILKVWMQLGLKYHDAVRVLWVESQPEEWTTGSVSEYWQRFVVPISHLEAE